MFQKLVSNLAYNPGLINQVSFYSSRLRKETAIRRVGFAFIALALVVQTAAVMWPAQKSLAASPNHILNGLTNKSSILQAWDANAGGVQAIYAKFGVTRANIAAIPTEKPNATIVTTTRDWWSIGRLPLTNFGISSANWGERVIPVGGTTIYQRPLKAWDTGPSSSYLAFHGKNSAGVDFWILQDCGNLTFDGPYLPKPPTPKVEIHKSLINSATVKPGDTVRYRIEYRNSVPESLATNYKVIDNMDSSFEFISSTGATSLSELPARSGNVLTLKQGNQLGYTQGSNEIIVNFKVKAGLPDGKQICNAASLNTAQSSVTSAEVPCVTVVLPCTLPGKADIAARDPACAIAPVPVIPPTPGCPAGHEMLGSSCVPVCVSPQVRQNDGTCKEPEPIGYCVASTAFVAGSSRDIVVQTNAYVEGSTKVEGYSYDVDANGTIDYKEKTSATNFEKTIKDLKPGIHKIAVKTQLSNTAGSKTETGICSTEISIAEDARVTQSKSVLNVTTNKDANGTKIKSGDVLRFSLKTENTTSTDYSNFTGEDYIGDVLNYADIVNESELTSQGITLDGNKYLRWTSPTIAAKSVEVKTITVKVKDVIPTTNRPSDASQDYDCHLSNRYGNEVTMNVGCPVVKGIESTAGKLPNTGPGTMAFVSIGVTVLAGYFLARSKLLAKELDIVRADYAVAGGM